MKKYTALLLIIHLFLLSNCGKEKKSETPIKEIEKSKHEWTEKDMLEFEKNCVGFLESDGVENAKNYCDCLLESSVKAYPDPDVAMELEQNEIVKLFVDSKCMNDLLLIKIEDPWTEEVEQIFLEHCKKNQLKNGVAENNAESYCDCALLEIKEIVPNPHHVMSLTQDELDHILNKCKP